MTQRYDALIEQCRFVPAKAVFIAMTVATVATTGRPPCSAADDGAVDSTLAPLIELLGQVDDAAVQTDVLAGIRDALQGRRNVKMPANWQAAYAELRESRNTDVRNGAVWLALLFGDAEALASLRATLRDSGADPAVRERAVDALVQRNVPDLAPDLHALLADVRLRRAALRGLAAYDHPATARLIVQQYASFSAGDKAVAIGTLASRAPFALALLHAVEQGRIPRRDLAAYTVRQLLRLESREIDARLEKVWGRIAAPTKDKAALIARYKAKLTATTANDTDPSRGRAVFARTCAGCHKLFDEGGDVGPELTGGQRANLDYVLENLLDPNALVGRDYQTTVILTNDGRVITGIVVREREHAVTMKMAGATLIVPKDEIDERRQLRQSMMPEDMLAYLEDDEVRDLIAYLASPMQVPLPAQE